MTSAEAKSSAIRWYSKALVFSALVSLTGCALTEHREALGTLYSASRDAGSQQKILAREDEVFHRIEEDLDNGRLNQGATKSEITNRYGEPVVYLKEEGQELWMYKSRGQFFGAKKIYLIFDPSGSLENVKFSGRPSAP